MQNLEEQLSTVSKKTRDDLAQERSELDQQRVLLMQEVHLNTLESSGGQFSFIKSFHVRRSLIFNNCFPSRFLEPVFHVLCRVFSINFRPV